MAFNVKGGKLIMDVKKKITCNDRADMVTIVKRNNIQQEIYVGDELKWRRGECGTG